MRVDRFQKAPRDLRVLAAGLLFLVLTGVGLGLAPAYATGPSETDLPASITIEGKKISLKNLSNPFKTNPENSNKALQEGGTIYFKQCFLCHGDLMDGKGLFGDRLFPAPADFRKPDDPIYEKSEAYKFWRIMKGGKGLPAKWNPWDSAMPAWEKVLSADEVWKVLLFIDTKVRQMHLITEPKNAKPSAERGREVYQEHCVYCHGEKGKGDGITAEISSPKPRRFHKGQYKIRTTPFGKIPTDQDLFDIITKGMPATTMPGWSHLPESDRWSLVAYLKTLSRKFKKYEKKKRKKPLKIIKVPKEAPKLTLESIERGQKLFMVHCSGCHGVEGRGDGDKTPKIVDIETDAIFPRNLSKPWTFRRGPTRKDIFLTLRTGLYGSAMPRFSERILDDNEIWDIVNFVQTLSFSPLGRPKIKHLIKTTRVDGTLPVDPADPFWKNIETYYFPLSGQVMQKPKSHFPTADGLRIRAAHNGKEIAFQVRWDDPNVDPAVMEKIPVKKSPPPPIPEELRGLVDPTEMETLELPPPPFPDALALQFPVHSGDKGQRPHFLNGDSKNPVNLWKWTTDALAAKEVTVRGPKKQTEQPKESQSVESSALYEYGQYQVVLKRKMQTKTSEDVQFKAGQKVPIAFNVWDGSAGETGSKMALSSWFHLSVD